MAELQDLIFESDLFYINEDQLGKVISECQIQLNSGSEKQLGLKLWKKMDESLEQRITIAQKLKGSVFVGRTSVSWYIFYNARENFCAESINSEINMPELQSLITNEPKFIGGAELEDGNYILRFIVKTGTSRRTYGTRVIYEPETTIISVLVSTIQNFIEVRCESKFVGIIIKIIRQRFIKEQGSLTKIENFSNEKIESLVKELGGMLFEASSHPEITVNDLKPEHVEAVGSVLEAIDIYFKTADIDSLKGKLDNAREIFADAAMVPFAVLILAGMDKISMGTRKGKDLREQALYKILQPYVRHMGSYARFPVVENGIEKSYTIRIGTLTKNIVFSTSATEKAIEVVRNKFLGLDKQEKER